MLGYLLDLPERELKIVRENRGKFNKYDNKHFSIFLRYI